VAAVQKERRTIRLHETTVDYTLRRSARRSYALQIDERGVRVAVPFSAPESVLEHFIRKHTSWVLDKLSAYERRARIQMLPVVDGISFPLLGEECRLRLLDGRQAGVWRTAADGVAELAVGQGADPLAAVVRALRQRGLPWFTGRVEEYCLRLGVDMPTVRLSSARTRWGSCSLVSGIRLHWRLIHLPAALGDYVVAHEVAHLLEMNHSPRFWRIVEKLYPPWHEARDALRIAGNELPILVAPPTNECGHNRRG